MERPVLNRSPQPELHRPVARRLPGVLLRRQSGRPEESDSWSPVVAADLNPGPDWPYRHLSRKLHAPH